LKFFTFNFIFSVKENCRICPIVKLPRKNKSTEFLHLHELSKNFVD
jgi:hypothetical protein